MKTITTKTKSVIQEVTTTEAYCEVCNKKSSGHSWMYGEEWNEGNFDYNLTRIYCQIGDN